MRTALDCAELPGLEQELSGHHNLLRGLARLRGEARHMVDDPAAVNRTHGTLGVCGREEVLLQRSRSRQNLY